MDSNSMPVSSAMRESSSRIPAMSGTAGIAVASRKMSATAIGWASSVFVAAAAAARAVSTLTRIVATSFLRSPASARFGPTSRNQKAAA
jgi:hypothetical protein